MDYSFGVRGIERVGHLNGPLFEDVDTHRLTGEALIESLALKQLHGDEALAVLLSDIVKRANIGMIQRRGRAGFALKSLQRLRIAGEFRRQKLERNVAAEARVFRLIHHSHAAGAELGEDAIVRDGLAEHGIYFRI